MKEQTGPRVWTTNTYNRLARFYDTFMKLSFPVGEKGREKIVQKLVKGTVLDVACGTGTLLAMADQKGLVRFGIDISTGMLAQAREKMPNAKLYLASYYKIPFPDEQFDNVVATNALSGSFINAEKVLSEMIRVCKIGGEVHIAEWPRAEEETFFERLFVKIASLNDDAPKDYRKIFKNLGYMPDVEALSKHYHIFSITKRG